MSQLDHSAASATGRPGDLPGALVCERVRGAAGDVWLGWTVGEHEVVVALAGDVCAVATLELTARIQELVWQFPERSVMLDLSRVRFADARAVSMLARLDRACRQSSSALTVTGASPPVRRLLQLCGWRVDGRGGSRRGSGDATGHGDGEVVPIRLGLDPIRN